MRKLIFVFTDLSLEKELLPWRFMISARQLSEKNMMLRGQEHRNYFLHGIITPEVQKVKMLK